jgi:hypothetical protein
LAVADLGISPKEFWGLSWFEWGCYLLRLEKQLDKEKFQWEESWEQTRIIWSLIANVNGNKFKPQDLIKLPRDKEVKENILLTPKQVETMFPTKLKDAK